MSSGSRFRNDERGVVAVVVAIFIGTVGIGAAAIAIDLGAAWASQRSLVTDTDAASLAGVRLLADSTPAACQAESAAAASGTGAVYDEVVEVLGLNTSSTELLSVIIACPATAADPKGASVRVEARQESIGAFAGALGFSPLVANGASVAEVGSAGELGGLIPLAVCEEELDMPLDIGSTYTIPFRKQVDQGCGASGNLNNGTGNWGWVGFDDNIGTGAGQTGPDCVDANNPTLACYIHQGFPDTVSLIPGDEKCGDKPGSPGETPCEASTGLVNSAVAEFWEVWGCPTGPCEDKIFTFLLFDTATGTGNNAEYSVTGFASAILRKCNGETPTNIGSDKCQATGAETNFTFEIAAYETSGAVGGPSVPQSTVRAMSVCGVRADAEGDRCALPIAMP